MNSLYSAIISRKYNSQNDKKLGKKTLMMSIGNYWGTVIVFSFFSPTQPTNLITGARAHQLHNSIKRNYSGIPRITRSTVEWPSCETVQSEITAHLSNCAVFGWVGGLRKRRYSSTVVHINVLPFEIQFGWDWIYDSVWCQWINGNEKLAVVYSVYITYIKPFRGQQPWLWLGERRVFSLVCTFGEIAFVQLRLIKRTIHHTSP